MDGFLKHEVIKQAQKANEDEILRDKELRGILKKYLEFIEFREAFEKTSQEKSKSESPISKIIECFELSEAIITGEKDLNDERRKRIDSLCFTKDWEDRFTKAIKNKTTDRFFKKLKRECSQRLSNNVDYQLFKNKIQ